MRFRPGLLAGMAGLVAIVLMVVTSTKAAAATRYVSDELAINMRLGPGTGYRISRLLNAGDELETLSEDSGWTRIRTADGATGYVLTRFLAEAPPARTRIAQMQTQNAELERENSELQSELSKALDGSEELGGLKRDLVAENAALKSELQRIRETSADAIRIGDENRKFREQLISLRSEVERLRHDNDALRSRREGMKIGALIMIGGVVLGLLLPLFRRRKKGSWDSL